MISETILLLLYDDRVKIYSNKNHMYQERTFYSMKIKAFSGGGHERELFGGRDWSIDQMCSTHSLLQCQWTSSTNTLGAFTPTNQKEYTWRHTDCQVPFRLESFLDCYQYPFREVKQHAYALVSQRNNWLLVKVNCKSTDCHDE